MEIPMTDDRLKALEELAKRLADEGKLVEAGWIAMRNLCIPPDAPQSMVEAMRYSYMAGAQHLFASMFSMLDPGIEDTGDDLRRMEMIADEMNAFSQEMELRFSKTKGNA